MILTGHDGPRAVRRAFTLVEVLVSAAIVAAILVPLIQAHRAALVAQRQARELEDAQLAALRLLADDEPEASTLATGSRHGTLAEGVAWRWEKDWAPFVVEGVPATGTRLRVRLWPPAAGVLAPDGSPLLTLERVGYR